ncbi:hypothetical protein BDN72DRAFT_902621 [Pluteus cervinus]|uniref:Uncharacterized protein n=1 Tax=Pluteus cervinus TaxID=181527 RepID=A0ACD3ABZ1_9AGAR|nr:hypothetical protein BDN72DRAFT_902621 [Pluteus cervinus]
MIDPGDLTTLTANTVLSNQYFTVASSTLYLYDLLLTLDLEANLLWPSKWTLLKVVYFLQRYLPLIDTMILVVIWEFGDVSPKTCESLYKASGYHSSTSSIPGLHCFATGETRLNALCWVLLTVFDIGLLVLIAIPAYRAYRSRDDIAVLRSMLIQVVYQDGILYYLYLVALSASNVVLTLNLPSGDYADLLFSLERIMYPILTSRVVLHIREQAYQSLKLPNSVNINAEAEFQRSEI